MLAAKHNDTRLNIKQKFSNETHRLSGNQHLEVNVSRGDYISVEADKPVMVIQYLVPDCKLHKSCGTFMLMVPPMEQRESQYLFSVLTSTGKQSVNLVITSVLREGLILDGKDLLANASGGSANEEASLNWTVIDTSTDVSYSAIQLSVDPGLHNLSHLNASALFAAMSYGYPLGMRLLELPVVDTVQYRISTHNGSELVLNYTLGDPDGDTPPRDLRDPYFKEKYENTESGGISSSLIAVVISLCSGVLLVIVCIVGFVLAELVCNGKEPNLFTRPKVAPLDNA